MVKCATAGCTNVAYYGQFYSMPTVCKVHAGPGAVSVVRKCSLDGCLMAAVSTKTTMCERCLKVHDDVDAFRLAKFRAWATQYGVEASAIGAKAKSDTSKPSAKVPGAARPAADEGMVVKVAPARAGSRATGATFGDAPSSSTGVGASTKAQKPARAKTPGRGLTPAVGAGQPSFSLR